MEIKPIKCENCVESCCSYGKDELNYGDDYTPTFTKEEVEKIKKKFGELNNFNSQDNSKNVFNLNLIKSKEKPSFYVCPFLDEKTGLCKIYELRSLDCRLFPFTFVNHDGEVYLALVDGSVCSFMNNADAKTIEELKKNMLEFIKKENVIETLKKYPALILDDEDVILVQKIEL